MVSALLMVWCSVTVAMAGGRRPLLAPRTLFAPPAVTVWVVVTCHHKLPYRSWGKRTIMSYAEVGVSSGLPSINFGVLQPLSSSKQLPADFNGGGAGAHAPGVSANLDTSKAVKPRP